MPRTTATNNVLIQNQGSILITLLVVAVLFFTYLRESNRYADVDNISVAEAKSLIDAGAVIIDVRGNEAFNNRHIPGAIHLPVATLRNGIPASLAVAKDQSIVVYCNDGIKTGPEGTSLLNIAGFSRAVNIQSGIEGWEAAQFPVVKK